MPINPDQLARSLGRGLRAVYLVGGEETLLIDECAEMVRSRARQDGFTERQRFTVESGFDWSELRHAGQSLSLFAERRLLEIRMPGSRPGEAGAETIQALAAANAADTVVLIICGKMEKPVRESKWVKAVENHGEFVMVWPMDTRQFPVWIRQRMLARGLEPEAGVVELLAWHDDGNPTAAAQEIDKLGMIIGRGRVSISDIEQNLADSARYSVFQLVDAALAGLDLASTRRMLASLRADGSEPILVLWALVREVRLLVQMARELSSGKPVTGVLTRVWQNRRAVVGKALGRFTYSGWLYLLKRAARVDRIIKGQAAGDRWIELERLLLAVGGWLPVEAGEMETL